MEKQPRGVCGIPQSPAWGQDVGGGRQEQARQTLGALSAALGVVLGFSPSKIKENVKLEPGGAKINEKSVKLEPGGLPGGLRGGLLAVPGGPNVRQRRRGQG